MGADIYDRMKIEVFIDNEIKDKGAPLASENIADSFAASAARIVRGEVECTEEAIHAAFHEELELRAFGGM